MSVRTSAHDTPAMLQYRRFKQQYPQCVLFFRMGDFYELFYDDAQLAHKTLGVTLTQRTQGIPMAGVPYHSVDGYLRRMIEAGHRVAICEQVEDPAQAKGLVRREVTRVITPGTVTDEPLLEEARDNPLAAVLFHDGPTASIAWAELSTGAFSLTTVQVSDVADELARIAPAELIYPEPNHDDQPNPIHTLTGALGCATAQRPHWQFSHTEAVNVLCNQFDVVALDGLGLDQEDPALGAASAVIHYLRETQQPAGGDRPLAHLAPPRRFERHNHLVVDQTSLRSLEIERTLRTGGSEGSLLGVLQGCCTAMGKRTLRQWLCYPLCQREAIQERLDVVTTMVEDDRLLGDLRRTLDGVQDVQRITGRIAVSRATPRDVVALGRSAAGADVLVQLLADRPAVLAYHQRLTTVANAMRQLAKIIGCACVDAPPAHLREGGLIRDGYDPQLDETRQLRNDSHTWLARYQKQLADESGITSLKIGFNKVFGYYIEVTAANKARAPQGWSPTQTLKNAERYTTPPLKEFEGRVLSARQRAVAREQELFSELCEQAQAQVACLHQYAQLVAELDVLACFADQAVRHHYTRPTIVDQPVLDIRGGRHPVLDRLLADQFVPNDVALGLGDEPDGPDDPKPALASGATLALITGPNMAGKSTYIRQTALIVLMAHTGSFVPADAATIGLCDRIFTRIGASDELHTGQSTFMVEMTETANICRHTTASSLLILDEIGRGTSTLDGLSLAWAIAEHLAYRRSRTLFATHYHELTSLADRLENVSNLNVSVREWDDQIVFLHRIVPGATNRSYGIYVAKIAGLPAPVVARAHELLGQLSVSHSPPAATALARSAAEDTAVCGSQLPLFAQPPEHPVMAKLRDLKLEQLSPMDAFDTLRCLCDEADQHTS